MKKAVALALLVLAFASIAFAQAPVEDRTFSINYYSNRNNTAGADQFVRIINPGTQGSPLSAGHGTICADIYVFDAIQEMTECCHCPITANGLLELSVLQNLTQNPLTGFPAANSGVIKLVSDSRANCNETAPVPVPELLAWGTHLQQPVAGTFVTTETQFLAAPLAGRIVVLTDAPTNVADPNATELGFLGNACSFVQFLGSGKGTCTCGNSSI